VCVIFIYQYPIFLEAVVYVVVFDQSGNFVIYATTLGIKGIIIMLSVCPMSEPKLRAEGRRKLKIGRKKV